MHYLMLFVQKQVVQQISSSSSKAHKNISSTNSMNNDKDRHIALPKQVVFSSLMYGNISKRINKKKSYDDYDPEQNSNELVGELELQTDIIAVDTMEGSCTKKRFKEFVISNVVSQMNLYLSKHSVLILNNACIHHDKDLIEYIESFGGPNSPVPLDLFNLIKNLSREGAAYFEEDDGEFKELFIFEFCKNEVICGDMAKKRHYIRIELVGVKAVPQI
ncbi:hypothetical protein C1645_821054 [Glomus cerebriforme]|uniref:Tc1-like transposase DDE domain-containing protein n=1 Tax=Glomus cerebriforme TaxID=658196 RepID=A0A397T1Y1_9GLOM|nr:hypothetical protein C1645_821054 [Glomus cerebriforme]